MLARVGDIGADLRGGVRAPDQSESEMPTSNVAELVGLTWPWLFHVRTVQVYSAPAVRADPP
ncbi:MAG TPA: hypothetical protein VGI55_04915 [Solirubrobacteraceae bacterium]